MRGSIGGIEMENGDSGLFDKKEPEGSIPKLNKCFLCRSWGLEKDLQVILVPDGATGYVRKLG